MGMSMAEVAKKWRESGMSKSMPKAMAKPMAKRKAKGGAMPEAMPEAMPMPEGGRMKRGRKAKGKGGSFLSALSPVLSLLGGELDMQKEDKGGKLKKRRGAKGGALNMRRESRRMSEVPPSVPVDRTFSVGSSPFYPSLTPHERQVMGVRIHDSGQRYQGVGMGIPSSNTMRTGNVARYGVMPVRMPIRRGGKAQGGSFTSFMNNLSSGFFAPFQAAAHLF